MFNYNNYVKRNILLKELQDDLKTENKIEVIMPNGKTMFYTKEKIKELVDQFDTYIDSDNLPKWLYIAGYVNKIPGFPKNKLQTKRLLQTILQSDKDVHIDLNSDTPYANYITYK